MCACVLQVFLGPNGEVEEYSVISIQQNTAISSDLILDQKEEHLFIMTQNMVRANTEMQHPGSGCFRCVLLVLLNKLDSLFSAQTVSSSKTDHSWDYSNEHVLI